MEGDCYVFVGGVGRSGGGREDSNLYLSIEKVSGFGELLVACAVL